MLQPKTAPSPVAVITGASSGIGYELSKLFARDGSHVVLIARSADALRNAARTLTQISGATVTTLAADLSRRDAPEEIVTELKRQHLQVHALVNNAGFGLHGSFMKTDLTTELAMIQVHVATLTHLTKLLLPDLVQTHGKILNVASIAAFQPTPLMAVYAATKAYVLSFSEALANEVRELGVSVTALCPGPTPTGFQQRAGMGLSRLTQGNLMRAETIAWLGYRGLMRKQAVVVPGWKNHLSVWTLRLLPRNLGVRLARTVQESRRAVTTSR
ncbi:MAG: SDR family oxidoreductase [Candidatus Omnitrophica bacterium]|nr:SDR family oxidoreductase [Candidatus Omnitrophota bacterium]MBI3083939.1 SDR family oxidoreductase [Candidatus Omnitrophota bacterium]